MAAIENNRDFSLSRTKLSQMSATKKSRSCDRLIVCVEIPGFEPGQTEPKSVVLPLHHISIPVAKIQYFCISTTYNITAPVS